MTPGEEPVDYLTVADLLQVADAVLGEVAVRDAGALASAAGRPQITVLGQDAYPTLLDKAAALMHSLARNHALVDGNKRLAWAAMRVFCLLNGRNVTASADEAEPVVVALAAGRIDVPELAAWLTAHLRG